MKPRLGRARPGGWTLAALALGAALGFGVAALSAYTAVELGRFGRAEARRAVLIHAVGQWLGPGVSVRAVDLPRTLSRLRYQEAAAGPARPGEFRRTPAAWDLVLRPAPPAPVGVRVRIELRGDRITRVLRDGQVVEGLHLEPEVLAGADERGGELYRPVRLADVPLTLLHAVLAAEDDRFFEHRGLDLRGVARALWVNIRAGRWAQGGSTITQQLVKNRLVGPHRTLGRKVREAWLAAMVEWRYGKEQILEAYLNEAYLGQRGSLVVRGVGAAARAYFRKEVHQLTPGEAALLAGMLRAPNSYSPLQNPERARHRRNVVLDRMRELGRLSEAEARAARAEAVQADPGPLPVQPAPYFVDWVQQELEQRLGAPEPGHRVLTGLDLPLQRFAEAAVARGLDRLEARQPALRRGAGGRPLQAALVVLDARTGAVRAMVGGRDYRSSQYNRAVNAHRQSGSAFKPFVFLAALRRPDGRPPALTPASFVDDVPLTLEVNGQPWSPRNYRDHYEGRVTVRRALEGSLNAATVRVAEAAGLARVVETARALGWTSPLAPVPALALGAFEVSPLELARAYVPLASGGWRPPAGGGVELGPGAGPAAAGPGGQQVLSPAEAYLVTSLLQGALVSGTGAAVQALGLTGPLAGKTGTTNDGRDAWFVGYTPALVAAVWVGYDEGQAHGLSGAEAALPLWADFMRQALEAYPAPPFAVPAGVTAAAVDPTTGKLATRFCPLMAREMFLSGTEPPPCDEHGWADRLGDWWRRFRDWLGR